MEFKTAAGEMANLWQFIIGNQAHLCLLEHWDAHAEDEDVKAILALSKKIANEIVTNGLLIYERAGFPKPIGFDVKQDVVPSAPRTMSDKLVLVTLHILAEYGVYGYGLALGKTENPEVFSFFESCLKQTVDLYKILTETVHQKGCNHQPVYIPAPQKAEMVENQRFLSGWWGEQRPLNVSEVANLINSLRGVILAKGMLTVFAQTAEDSKVKKLCQKGKELAEKRIKKFQVLNAEENIPYQATYESEITEATSSTFSDRFIMFEMLSLLQIAVARYGNALSFIVRRDLSVMFAGLIVETGTFVDDAISLMIEKNWFEQPPLMKKGS